MAKQCIRELENVAAQSRLAADSIRRLADQLPNRGKYKIGRVEVLLRWSGTVVSAVAAVSLAALQGAVSGASLPLAAREKKPRTFDPSSTTVARSPGPPAPDRLPSPSVTGLAGQDL